MTNFVPKEIDATPKDRDPFEQELKTIFDSELAKVGSLPPVQHEVTDPELLTDPLYLKAKEDPFLLTESEELELLAKFRKSKANGY